MKILLACEESQAITKQLRKLGHEAFSCDLLPCSGGHPEWHFQDDVIEIMNGWFDCNEVTINDNFSLRLDVWSGNQEFEYKNDRIRQIGWEWDLMIAHPPCTFLAVSGARWLYNKDGTINEERLKNQKEGLDFVQKLMDAPIHKIAIENPISVISSQIRKPDQIIQPYYFGDEAQKTTCLWLKNLPKLYHNDKPNLFDNVVTHSGKGEFVEWINDEGVKKRQAKWFLDALNKAKTPQERRTLRSKTFYGIANAMATQWTNL